MKSIPYPWILLKPISYRVVRPEIQSLYSEWGTIRNKLRTQIESTIESKIPPNFSPGQNLSDDQKTEIETKLKQKQEEIETKVDVALHNIAIAQQIMATSSKNRQNRRQTLRPVASTIAINKATK